MSEYCQILVPPLLVAELLQRMESMLAAARSQLTDVENGSSLEQGREPAHCTV